MNLFASRTVVSPEDRPLSGRSAFRPLNLATTALTLGLILTGCGGGDEDTSTQVRLVNASAGYSTLSLGWDDTTIASSVEQGAASSYTGVSSGTVDATLSAGDSSTALETTERSTSDDTQYSIVAYGWKGSLKSIILTENEEAADSGYAKFRIYNSATDAGSLDVYLTDTSASLEDSTAVASSVSTSAFNSAGFLKVKKGNWRLRVTGADDKDDLRLDVSSMTLSDQEVYTLVLSPTSGGVMVNSVLIPQGDSVSYLKTTLARARLVAGVSATTTPPVSASLGSTTLASSTASPAVGGYKILTAGDGQSLSVSVSGTSLGTTSVDVEAGQELSVLVSGSASAATVQVIEDDNRLPTSGKAKVRLVHGSEGTADLFLTVNYAALASNIAYGTASSYSTVTASSSSVAQLEVNSATSTLFTPSSDLYLQSQGVYSVFVLGSGGTVVGRLSKDR